MEFPEFFKLATGFEMNHHQKMAWDCYCSHDRNKTCFRPRQTGMTTFMAVLAAWRAMDGKWVVIVYQNERLRQHTTDIVRNVVFTNLLLKDVVIRNVRRVFFESGGNIDFVSMKNYESGFVGIRADDVFVSNDSPSEDCGGIRFWQYVRSSVMEKSGIIMEIGTREWGRGDVDF